MKTLAFFLLEIALGLFVKLYGQGKIEEGERDIIAKQLASAAKAMGIATKIRDEVEKMPADEVDSKLGTDFRS